MSLFAATTACAIAACNDNNETPSTNPGDQSAVYTVVFDTNGGTLLPEQGAEAGDKATKPGDPKKPGYVFGGWYKDAACTVAFNFETAINANTTIYAKWTPAPTTDNSYFRFIQDGNGWSVAARPGITMPSDVVIPEEYDGKEVVSIANGGFEDVSRMMSIAIPDTVTSIGTRAFHNASDLGYVYGGENVEVIESNAFTGTEWDNSLSAGIVYLGKVLYKYAGSIYIDTSIEVADGTLGIAAGAFLDLSRLTGVTLPEGLKYIGSYAFGASEAKYGNKISSVVIPDSVVEIGANAFRNAKSLTAVAIGEGVEYIGANAFLGTDITEMTFNAVNGVIANETFKGLTSPATLTVGDKVEELPINLLKGWQGLESVSLGEKITVIPTSVFDGLSNLSNVTYGNIVRIGGNAFRGTALTSVTLPESLVRLGSSAFEKCKALTAVTLNAPDLVVPNSTFPAFKGCTALKEVTVGDSVKVVPEYIFANIPSLTTLTLGANIESIEMYAFYNTSLTGKLVLPDSLVSLAEHAFDAGDDSQYGGYGTMGEMKLEKVVIPAGLKELGSEAFANNSELTSLVYNAVDAVASIYSAPGGAINTPKSAFYGCNALTYVTIGSKVKTIPQSFIESRKNVASVDLNNVTTIGANAFYGCSALANIGTNNGSSIANLGATAFNGTAWYSELTKEDGPVYIGKILVAYSGTMPSGYSLSIKAGTTTIAEKALYSQKNLTSVTFPTSLTTINYQAFYGCSGLTALNLQRVATIGEQAFYSCSGLKTITFNGSYLKYIGNWAFNSCSGLSYEDFTLPGSVEYLGERAFFDMKMTGTLTINAGSLTEIGDMAFAKSTPTTVVLPENVTTLGGSWLGRDSQYRGDLSTVTSFTAPGLKSVGSYGLANLADDSFDISNIEEFGDHALFGWKKETVEFNENATFGAGLFTSWHQNNNVTKGNDNIKHVIFKGVVEEIPNEMFYKTPNLETVEFAYPEKLVKLGDKAFQESGIKSLDVSHVVVFGDNSLNNSKIETNNLNLSANLERIGASAFDGCTGITGDVVIGGTVTEIPDYAFQNTRISNLTVRGNIVSIAGGSFRSCSALENVIIEEGVQAIDYTAFFTSTPNSITLPASVMSIGNSNTANANLAMFSIIKLSGFCEPSDLGEKSFSSTAYIICADEEIAAKVKASVLWEPYVNRVYSNSDLIDNNWIIDEEGTVLKYVGDKTTINIPKEAKSFSDISTILGTKAAVYQKDITITVAAENPSFKYENGMLTNKEGTVLYFYNGTGDTISSSTIVEVKPYALYYNKTAKTLTLNNAATVGNYAFAFSAVENASLNALEDVVTYLFDGAASLETVSLNAATALGNYSFRNCTSLTTFTAGKVATLGTYVFQNDALLATLTLGTITEISNYDFAGCKALTSFNLTGITKIGAYAFQNAGISEIEIPDSVASVGNYAFSGCPLTSVTVRATTPPTGGLNMFGTAANFTGTIYVPSESVDTYKAATRWSTYAAKIQAIED